MTWEIADRENPDRAGDRFDRLAEASAEIGRRGDRGRWFARWTTGNEATTQEDGQ